MLLPITLTIAAAAALINIWLGVRIGAIRTQAKIFIGDGGHEPLVRRMRAQANFLENTPFVLILLGAIELAIGYHVWLSVLGVVYILGRIAHVFGMDGARLPRMMGTIITLLTQAVLAFYAIYLVYSRAGMA
jgi:uncharacterized protein